MDLHNAMPPAQDQSSSNVHATWKKKEERFPAAAHAFEQHTQMWVINGCQSET